MHWVSSLVLLGVSSRNLRSNIMYIEEKNYCQLVAKTWPQPSSFLQKIPLGCVLERSLGKVVEVVPGIEDPGEGLEVEDVPVRMMRGRGSSELGSAVVTIGDPGDGGGGDRGLGPGGEPRSGGGNRPEMRRP